MAEPIRGTAREKAFKKAIEQSGEVGGPQAAPSPAQAGDHPLVGRLSAEQRRSYIADYNGNVTKPSADDLTVLRSVFGIKED